MDIQYSSCSKCFDFYTTPSSSNGSDTPLERMSIRANGNVDVKNTLTLGGGYAAAQKMSSDSNSRDLCALERQRTWW